MPLFEFECEACGELFEDIAPQGVDGLPCPVCASHKTHRLISAPSPLAAGAFPFRPSAPRPSRPAVSCPASGCAMKNAGGQK